MSEATVTPTQARKAIKALVGIVEDHSADPKIRVDAAALLLTYANQSNGTQAG